MVTGASSAIAGISENSIRNASNRVNSFFMFDESPFVFWISPSIFQIAPFHYTKCKKEKQEQIHGLFISPSISGRA
jgi:hypothetical protein